MLSSPVPVLVFRVSGLTCALPSSHVIETMRPLPVTELDDMPPFVHGVATIRGMATPVLDVAALLERPASSSGRFVTVRADARVVALAVDDVLGMSWFPSDQLESRPPLLTSAAPHLVRTLAVSDGALHLVLDAARLARDAAGS